MNTFPLLETEPLSPEANHRIFTALAREMTLDAPAVAIAGAELVEDATISYLQPDEPSSRGHRRGWLLGLVAAAAALLTVGIMVRDNSARTRTNTDVTPETMPIYLPTVLPDGFTFSYGDDYTNGPDSTPPFRDQVYRDLSKPIGERAVQITTSLAWTGVELGHPIVIQGRPAFDASVGDSLAIALVDGQVSIRIVGRGVPYSDLERIAGSAKAASSNPEDGASVDWLPDGLTLVVNQTAIPANRSINVSYSLADDPTHQLTVQIWPTSSQNLDQWTMARPSSLTPTTVRSHDAISFAGTEQDELGVVWHERKDVLIGVVGSGLNVEQVRQAAESLRRVNSKQWTDLLKSKGIAVQDDGSMSPTTSAQAATTAPSNSGGSPVGPGNLPLLSPQDAQTVGELKVAKDMTVGTTFDGRPRISRRLIYRETGAAFGSRSLQVEWSYARFTAANPNGTAVEGQAPFTEAVPPATERPGFIDPNGVYFRLSGRGLAQDELEAVAKSLTAPWGTDRINVPLLPTGFVEVDNRDTSYEQYRSTVLDYGSVSVALNPVGSGGIESYAIATPGSLTATKVRGHDGYVVSDPPTNTLRLVWVESPGLLVEVKGTGTDAPTLQRLAESLQPVSTDAWKRLLATVGAKPETVQVR
jgi:hypothetical protein